MSLIHYSFVSDDIEASIELLYRSQNTALDIPWQQAWLLLQMRKIYPVSLKDIFVYFEHEWRKDPVCIAAESALVEHLCATCFNCSVSSLFPSSRLFSISLPEDAKIGGQCIEGIFVALLKPTETANLIEGFGRQFSVPAGFRTLESQDYKLFVCFKNPHDTGYLVTRAELWRLEFVLQAESLEEFNALLPNISDSFISNEISNCEQHTQFHVIRFVLSLINFVNDNPTCRQATKTVKIKSKSGKSRTLNMSLYDHIEYEQHG